MADEPLADDAEPLALAEDEIALRDHFAGQVLNALVNNSNAFPNPLKTAVICYAFANAMMLVRSQQP